MDRTKTGTLLNAYCDSMGGQLKDIVEVLKKDEFKDTPILTADSHWSTMTSMSHWLPKKISKS